MIAFSKQMIPDVLTVFLFLLWFRWFCHVDDDNYVNVKTLVKLLSNYPHTQDMYIGKPSLDRPIEATERLGDNKMVRFPNEFDLHKTEIQWV